MAKPKTSPEVAFSTRYEICPSGCWEWTGEHTPRGYGQWVVEKIPLGNERYSKRRIYAHRLSWELSNGPIPDGLRVLHRCDNPACVNPDHLFLGTAADNTHDMIAKGRMAEGERKAKKLTEQDVRAIRLSDKSLSTLSKQYGVVFQVISEIRRRKIWKSVI